VGGAIEVVHDLAFDARVRDAGMFEIWGVESENPESRVLASEGANCGSPSDCLRRSSDPVCICRRRVFATKRLPEF